MGGDALYGKALSNALSLTCRNLAVPKRLVKTKQRVMLIGCVIPRGIYISRGLRRCSSLTNRAMPEPLQVGRVTDLTPTLFCILAKDLLTTPFREFRHNIFLIWTRKKWKLGNERTQNYSLSIKDTYTLILKKRRIWQQNEFKIYLNGGHSLTS